VRIISSTASTGLRSSELYSSELVAVGPIAITVDGINTALGGTTLLIVVGVAIETQRQLESQMMMRHYKGFLE
jgi:preprotein translocase subunit SecY